MGAPNDGPFSYVSGSLELYAEALNYHMNDSSTVFLETFKSKNDFCKAIEKIPSTIQNEARKFAKRTSSAYEKFQYRVHKNGLHVFMATKPGYVPNSYAEYVKIVYKDGTIRAFYKDTIDNKGRKVHRHIKWPAKEI